MLHHHAQAPRLENDLMRNPRLGFEPSQAGSVVRCIEHGFPTPLACWHCHDEYELQLIVETRGRAFVGDYVGDFEPGHLVLTGPRLPHNWISTHATQSAGPVSRLVMQFLDEPLRRGMAGFAELADLDGLLQRARHGIEFFGLSEQARQRFYSVRQSRGSRRLAEFLALLCDLAECQDYRLLSSAAVQSRGDDRSMERLQRVIEHLNAHFREPMPMGDIYALAGMSQSTFSRSFSRVTGSTFTEYVNRLRVHRACELLMETDRYVAEIGFEVGFHNLANFNRRFAELKGMTPTAFRRQAAERLGPRVALPSAHGQPGTDPH